ncbi:MAG: DUF885 family protein [Gemmatimonadales bacterium]
MSAVARSLSVALLVLALPPLLPAQHPSPASWVPSVRDLVGAGASSELRAAVERYDADRDALRRRFDAEGSTERYEAFRSFDQRWLGELERVDFDRLGLQGKIDYTLLANFLRRDLAWLERDQRRFDETRGQLPFAATILSLHDQRRDLQPVEASALGRTLADLTRSVDSIRRLIVDSAARRPTRIVALRAAEHLGDLARVLDRWYGFHAGYDPVFTWWAKQPYETSKAAIERYRTTLRETVVGVKPGEDEPIVGDPIGREALVQDLAFEMIPYGPEDLLAIAEREFAWCEAEMRKAAREMGFGDDWRAALEKVKTLHVEPGLQPQLVRDLAFEAIDFVEQRGLVTVPPLAKSVWRMEMMSPERQKESPFFLGGETILVSFPTDAMAEADKQMSMRGNNVHFSRATVFHELIPGHHLQGFMGARYQPHRQLFGTPFWTEGWALYWEMLLWDLGFHRSPEDRVGALFWRSHRAARIIFSLKFHLGEMTPDQAIDLLVNRVGHERANATAEVRRSFNGSYPPLYQLAYMMGGLQFRALHRELVGSGRMTDREFHDAVLQSGRMPVEMVRAALTGQAPTRGYRPTWRFDQGRRR